MGKIGAATPVTVDGELTVADGAEVALEAGSEVDLASGASVEVTANVRPPDVAPFESLSQSSSAVENGATFDGQAYRAISVQIEGIVATDIIHVQARNDDSLAFIQIGDDIEEDGVYAVEPGARDYRVRVNDNSGGGTIDAFFVGT